MDEGNRQEVEIQVILARSCKLLMKLSSQEEKQKHGWVRMQNWKPGEFSGELKQRHAWEGWAPEITAKIKKTDEDSPTSLSQRSVLCGGDKTLLSPVQGTSWLEAALLRQVLYRLRLSWGMRPNL
jgi:hypothetical protein